MLTPTGGCGYRACATRVGKPGRNVVRDAEI